MFFSIDGCFVIYRGYIIITERAGLCDNIVHYFTSGIVQNNEYTYVSSSMTEVIEYIYVVYCIDANPK